MVGGADVLGPGEEGRVGVAGGRLEEIMGAGVVQLSISSEMVEIPAGLARVSGMTGGTLRRKERSLR